MSSLYPVVFLVGPTAVGKSKVAVALAKRLQGEIISADAMQVYRGMDIGTAKPTLTERKKVPHHLYDIVSPARKFSVHEYRKHALKVLRDVAGRGKIPIVTGGSGLYVRALIDGLAELPGGDVAIRRRLNHEARDQGSDKLYARLKSLDPATAAAIHPANVRRILRALEILEISGKKPSQWYRERDPIESYGFKPFVFGLTCDRAILYERIERRVDHMFRRGLVQEVSSLLRGKWSMTASQAVGYKEIRQVLKQTRRQFVIKSAAISLVKDQIKRNTRRFAKRQMTWFKKERDIQWIECHSLNGVAEASEKICRMLKPMNLK